MFLFVSSHIINSDAKESALMSSMETSDPKWQVSDRYKPDKEGTWSHPAKADGWVLAHNAIRGEITDFIEALQSISKKYANSTPLWAVDSIQKFWIHHETFVHHHHTNEDDIMTPFMKTRITLPEKLEADHIDIIARMNGVSKIVKELKEGDSVDDLLSSVIAYKTLLLPHLLEEEEIALPLVRAFFTHGEVKKPVMKILQTSGKAESGSFVYRQGEEYFRSVFMKQEKIPFFVWYLKFKNDHNYFKATIQCHIDALKEGIPSTAAKKSVIC